MTRTLEMQTRRRRLADRLPELFYCLAMDGIYRTDPQVLLCVRGAFGASMMCMFATLAYIYTLVSSNRDERRVRIKEKKQFGVVQVRHKNHECPLVGSASCIFCFIRLS